jgi:hypothetical protein
MQQNQDFQPPDLKVIPLPVQPSHPPAPSDSTPSAVLTAPDRTPTAQAIAPYTAVFLAKENGVADVTLRTRWFPQLCNAAPESALKTSKGYTELARQLFSSYASAVASGNLSVHAWVEQEKTKHAHEWAQAEAEVVSAELVPDEATVSLSTLKGNNLSLQQQMETQLAQLEQFSQAIDDMELEFSAQELEEFRMKGAMRGMQRYQVERQAELQAYHTLRTQKTQKPQTQENS